MFQQLKRIMEPINTIGTLAIQNSTRIIYANILPYLNFQEQINTIKFLELQHFQVNYSKIYIDNIKHLNFLQTNRKHFNYLQLKIVGSLNIHKKIKFNQSINSLSITQADLKVIPPLYGLDKLTHVDLSSNRIKKFNNLNYINNISHLYIRINYIKEIQNVQFLTKLTHLDMGVNTLTSLEGFGSLKNLTHLDLTANAIKKNRKTRNSY